jgi:hypothetical protein
MCVLFWYSILRLSSSNQDISRIFLETNHYGELLPGCHCYMRYVDPSCLASTASVGVAVLLNALCLGGFLVGLGTKL